MLSLCACSQGGGGSSGGAGGKGAERSEIEKCLQGLSSIQNLEEAIEAGYRIKSCGYSEEQITAIVR